MSNFMCRYVGKPYDTKKMTIPGGTELPRYDILSKVFKAQSPGIGCLLKVYAVNAGQRTYVASVAAEVSQSFNSRGGRSIKVSSRDFMTVTDENFSPTDL